VLLQAHTADVVNIVSGDVYRRISLYAPAMVNEAVLEVDSAPFSPSACHGGIAL
jgi:hypothetical protein